MRRIYGLALAALAAASCARPAPPAPPSAPTPRPFDPAGVPAEGLDEARAYALLATDDLAVVSTAVDSQLVSNPKAYLTDGNQGTGWTNGGDQNATAWAQAQVGADAMITGIGIKTGPTAAGCSYDVQVSADGQAWTTALAGQEFDVTGLPTGYYWVVLKVDPLGQFLQARRDNDEVWTRIYLNAGTGRTYAVGYSE